MSFEGMGYDQIMPSAANLTILGVVRFPFPLGIFFVFV